MDRKLFILIAMEQKRPYLYQNRAHSLRTQNEGNSALRNALYVGNSAIHRQQRQTKAELSIALCIGQQTVLNRTNRAKTGVQTQVSNGPIEGRMAEE